MTTYECEIRYGDTKEGLAQGTHRVPSRLPSRDPKRPRKEGDYATNSTEDQLITRLNVKPGETAKVLCVVPAVCT